MANQVGFIGLGIMGRGMAARIADAGLPLVVFDTSDAALAPFRDRGRRSPPRRSTSPTGPGR